MPKKDFFISYAEVDEAWAKWIAWQLEKVLNQRVFAAYDVGPGDNLVLAIQRALVEVERTIVLLSGNTRFDQLTDTAWSTIFSSDPDGAKRLLVPIRIENIKPTGLFTPLVSISLFDADEQTALERLRDGIRRERGVPNEAPKFPNAPRPLFPLKAQEKTPSAKKHALNPEFAAAMLDKQPQVQHVLKIVPKDIRLRNGKTVGFVLSGHFNQWPEAVRHKMAYGLMLVHDKDKKDDEGVSFLPLQEENLDNLTAGEFLRQSLTCKLGCDETDTALVAALAHQTPQILYRILSPQEAKNHRWLVDILQAWRDLGAHLPPQSASHFLILIHPVMEKPGGWFWFRRHDDVQTWLEAMSQTLQSFGLLDSLLPKLDSPKRDEIPNWASTHLPENIKDEIQDKVYALFGDHEALPHGDLKKHIVQLLKPYVS